MRIHLMLAGIAVASLTAASATAQDGEYSRALTRMLTEAAEGRCPADVMAEDLATACQEQIAGMAPAVRQLGPIETMTFVKAEDTPGGRVETYSVKFAGGQTMTWRIGHLRDGKFETAGGGGE